MPDYSKGKIYTIRCLNDPNVYVGSTIQSLAVRMGQHRKSYYKNEELGCRKEIIKNINEWKIELHELYPCNYKTELKRREGEVIREIGTLNKNIAGRTKKEYLIDNADKIKEYKKQYDIKNADKHKEQCKEYYIKNADKRKEQIKEYKKQYDADNKEEIKQYNKQYRLKKKLAKLQILTE